MSYWLAIAGVLSSGFVLLHVVGGGADVHAPLLTARLAGELQAYVSVLWHGFAVSMVLCSGLLLIATWHRGTRKVLTLVTVVQYVGFAGVFLFYGWVRFDSVLVMPQWIGFLAIVLVALVGLWRDPQVSFRQVQV